MSPDSDRAEDAREGGPNFPFEEPIREIFPALHEAQSTWMSQIESLRAPDRKTHELIRLVCLVVLRNGEGIARHAGFAREVGASWDEVLGSIMLTIPGFGLLPAAEAIPHARAGFDSAREPDEDDNDQSGDQEDDDG